MRTNNPGHLKSFDYLGLYRYFLTFCVNDRKTVFANEAVVTLVMKQILRAATENRFAVLAYCFMPDYLHLLVEGEADNSDCRRFIKSSKQYSGGARGPRVSVLGSDRYTIEQILESVADTRSG